MAREDLCKEQMKMLLDNRMLILVFILCASFGRSILAVSTQIPIAPEPVGSGARALGQSAFIAVVDDATAASWNPAGLINLEKPEASFVGAWKINTIDLTSTKPNFSYDEDSWGLGEINFMSYAQPMKTDNMNVVISVNYHQVYDLGMEFNRKWLDDKQEVVLIDKSRAEGAISAYSLAGGLSMPDYPNITIGASFNWYTQSLLNDHVRELKRTEYDPSVTVSTETLDDLRGYNFTFGLLWDAYEKDEKLLTLGLVYHSPFTAEMEYKLVDPSLITPKVASLDIDFPLSLGVGMNYRFSDECSMAFDVQWTEWSEFNSGIGELTIPDDSLAYRLGFEHLTYPQVAEQAIFALRYGAFYEPRPTWDEILPVYGLSAGIGWTFKEQFSLDLAYQYRWGEDDLEYFKYRVKEHFFVVSLIKYF